MKKKLLLVLLLCVFVPACSKVEEGKIKITYQTMETLPEQRKALEKLVSEFEAKNPNIKIEVLTSTISFQKLSIQIAGGDAPDIFYYVTDRLPGFAEKNILLDLTPYMGEVDLTQYFSQTVESCKLNGKFYCFPYHFSTDILFYNKDIFDKEGVFYPNESWTWQDFVDAAQKLTKKENNRIVQYGTLQPRPLLVIKSFGGECFDQDVTKCTLNSQAARDGIQFILDLDKKYNVAPSATTIKDMERMDGVDMFSTGRVAMLMGRTFMLSEFRKLKRFNWDIAPVPKGKIRYSRLAVGVMCISQTTKHPKEAWEFVKFLCGKEGSYITGISGNCVPAYKESAYSKDFLVPPPENAKLFVDSIEYSQSDNPGLSMWEEFYQRVVQDNIDKILCGVVSMDDGLRKMEKEGTELLKKK
jgi:multiple sugar transport system substrate-binding protein